MEVEQIEAFPVRLCMIKERRGNEPDTERSLEVICVGPSGMVQVQPRSRPLIGPWGTTWAAGWSVPECLGAWVPEVLHLANSGHGLGLARPVTFRMPGVISLRLHILEIVWQDSPRRATQDNGIYPAQGRWTDHRHLTRKSRRRAPEIRP